MPRLRQTGVTTRQITNAPVGAVYVWVNAHLGYPKDLARALKRTDLRIVSPCWLNRPVFGGYFVILDHAVELTSEQRRNYETYKCKFN